MDADDRRDAAEAAEIVSADGSDADLANATSETTEIDITGDGHADGIRSVSTEIREHDLAFLPESLMIRREHDLDGDGAPDLYETITVEQTSVDVDGDGVPDVVTTVETSEVEMDLTGDGEIDSFEMTEVRTVAHDIDGDGMPNVTRTEVVTASGIDPDNGRFRDVEASGVRLYGLDTTGDGVIDDLVAEELEVEVVEDDEA